MPRPLGRHSEGDPAHDTMRSAGGRLVATTGRAIDPRALEVMLDDALAPELATAERVDTLMLVDLAFAVADRELAAAPVGTGRRGLLAFTERRMIATFATGIVSVRRSTQTFHLDGASRFRAVTPTVDGRPLRLVEVANATGWHRICLPGPTEVAPRVLDAWDHHIAARLVGALTPTWAGTESTGWVTGNATVPVRRPTELMGIDDGIGS